MQASFQLSNFHSWLCEVFCATFHLFFSRQTRADDGTLLHFPRSLSLLWRVIIPGSFPERQMVRPLVRRWRHSRLVLGRTSPRFGSLALHLAAVSSSLRRRFKRRSLLKVVEKTSLCSEDIHARDAKGKQIAFDITCLLRRIPRSQDINLTRCVPKPCSEFIFTEKMFWVPTVCPGGECK